MVQFCIAYCGILAEHSLCATHVTGKLVSEATGLPITLYLHADQGGSQQIGARISFNEIDLVLFFCDPANPNGFDDINKIERLCDQYQIPFATNAATAEVSPPTPPRRRCSYRACGAAISTGATSSIRRGAELSPSQPDKTAVRIVCAPAVLLFIDYHPKGLFLWQLSHRARSPALWSCFPATS